MNTLDLTRQQQLKQQRLRYAQMIAALEFKTASILKAVGGPAIQQRECVNTGAACGSISSPTPIGRID